jgi:hypothetical protein
MEVRLILPPRALRQLLTACTIGELNKALARILELVAKAVIRSWFRHRGHSLVCR